MSKDSNNEEQPRVRKRDRLYNFGKATINYMSKDSNDGEQPRVRKRDRLYNFTAKTINYTAYSILSGAKIIGISSVGPLKGGLFAYI